MFKNSLFILLSSAFLCVTSSLHAENIHKYEESLKDIDLVINEIIQRFNVPGIAVGIIAEDKVILSRGYGVRNLETSLPVTEKTLFPIASGTKAFTSLILGQLVDEGLISWDDLVINHLPEFRLFDDQLTHEITIRDLLAHRTGIPRHDAIWYFNTMPRSEVIPCLQYLEPVCKLREQWYYNNFMYSIAGIIIERITGQSWEGAVSSKIFSPLRMVDSNVNIKQLQQSSNFSLPYAEIDDTVELLTFQTLETTAPGSAINSTIIDMMKWAQLHLSKGRSNENFVQPKIIEEMHSLQMSMPNGRDIGIPLIGYGLGWFVGHYNDYTITTHGGVIDGFRSEILLLPQKNIGVVFLSNSSSNGPYAIESIRNTILDRLLNLSDTDWIESAQKKYDKAKESLRPKIYPELTNPPLPLDDFVGIYAHPAYGDVQIYHENNQLSASYGKLIISLRHTHAHSFEGQIRELLIYGAKRMTDFEFSAYSSEGFNEVFISFEPEAQPLKFLRQSTKISKE